MENSGFPDDLLLQILLRLPPKSLLRFKYVSKSWHVLISSQYFAKMHLNHSVIGPKSQRLICRERGFMQDEQSIDIFAADFSNLEKFPDTIQRLHYPLKVSKWARSTIIGSSNGLLCSNWVCYKDIYVHGYTCDESFLIFNPLTRKCQWISGETGWHRDGRSNFYGFGYDDVHDDYKVVTWDVRPNQSSEYYPPDCSKFEVYSVSNGSWSTRISALNSIYMAHISSGVLVNCVLHWMWKNCTIPGSCKYDIVAFDLRNEEHWSMETPIDLAIPGIDDVDEYYCRLDLGVLNGCLCGIVYDGEDSSKLDLWVMKVYGVKDSWIKMTIDMSPQIQFTGELYTKLVTPIVPIEHVEKNEQLMLYSYEKGFVLCDMVTNKLSKVIKIPEFGPKRRGKFISNISFVPEEFCFQGSLVELPGFCSFDSFEEKRRRMLGKAKRRRKQDYAW